MPLISILAFPTSSWTTVDADPSGSIPIPPGHLHSCYDWHLDDSSPEVLASIPPSSWLAQFTHPPLPAKGLSNPKYLRDNEDDDVGPLVQYSPPDIARNRPL